MTAGELTELFFLGGEFALYVVAPVALFALGCAIINKGVG